MSLEMSECDPLLCPDWLCARQASLSLCCRASLETQTALHDRHNKLPPCLLARACRTEPSFPRTACEKLDGRTSFWLGNSLLTGRDKNSPCSLLSAPLHFLYNLYNVFSSIFIISSFVSNTISLNKNRSLLFGRFSILCT